MRLRYHAVNPGDEMITALLLACATNAPEIPTPGAMTREGATLTTVNGQNVTQGMLDNYLLAMPEPLRKQIEERGQIDMIKEKVILQEVLYQEALAANLHTEPKVQILLAISAREALSQALLENVITERTSEEQVKAWYDDHAVQYRKPQVNANHILVEDEALALEIKGKLTPDNANFGELAKAHSKDPSAAQNGGELGWFEQGQMVPAFAEAAFAGEKGSVVGPVESRFGWHVIQIVDKRETTPLEDVRDEIEAKMGQEIATEFLEEMKAKAQPAPAPAASVEVPAAG
jgi:peptidyl-prolyl cis-trans isomerase C